MKNITEKQFKNFRKALYRRFDHIFLRLDEQDNMIGDLYKKMDLSTEEMIRRTDEMARRTDEIARRNDKMDVQILELKEMNRRMDARITSLEDWRSSVAH